MKQYEILIDLDDKPGKLVRINVGDSSVTIPNSAEITRRKEQKFICQLIKTFSGLPASVEKRSWRSLRREWRAHNLLYRLPFLPSGWKERLRDVDMDAEPLWRRAVYFVLALI